MPAGKLINIAPFLSPWFLSVLLLILYDYQSETVTRDSEKHVNVSNFPGNKNTFNLPFKSAGRLFITDAVIDGVAGNLVFDSGTTEIVLNRTYFRNYARTETTGQKGITGNVNDVEKINIGEINISGLRFRRIEASLSDLSHIENRRGVKILGIFGFELLKDFEITIDAVNNQMELSGTTSEERVRKMEWNKKVPDVVLKTEIRKNIVFLQGEVAGLPLKFCLDTGAEISVISSRCPKQVLNTFSVDRKVTLKGAGTATNEVLYGKLKELRFGKHSVNSFETIVAGLDGLGEAYGMKIDGMLGYNFLKEAVIRINFAEGRTSLWFNKNLQ